MAQRRRLDILEGGEFERDGEFFPEGEELDQEVDLTPEPQGDPIFAGTDLFGGDIMGNPPSPDFPPPGLPPGETLPVPQGPVFPTPTPPPEPPPGSFDPGEILSPSPIATGPGERSPSTPTRPTTPRGQELPPELKLPRTDGVPEVIPPPPEVIGDEVGDQGPPGGPGDITLPDSPFPQFLEDALSQLTQGQGATEFGQGLQQQILDILGRGGRPDDDTTNLEFENARGLIDRARRSQTNEARAALAGRGQLSVPGIEQGGNRSTIGRIEERLAPFFSQAVRDISINQGQRADRRFGQALQAGGSLATGGASNLLGAGGLALGQQEFVTRTALDNLDQNRQWNEFLAQHGLDREKLLFEMEQGNIEAVITLLQQFVQATQISAGGQV